MTIKELKKTLARYGDNEQLSVNMFVPGTDKPVAAGEVLGVNRCPCCHDPNLVVLLTDYEESDAETPQKSSPRPMDFTPTR